jgi:hypothetical protein
VTNQVRLRLVAVALLLAFTVGVASIVARAYVIHSYKHVVVRIFNVNDVARLSVNCHMAKVVMSSRATDVDLGWLDPGDDIYLSAFNRDGGAAWGFRIEINGERLVGGRHGSADSVGLDAHERSLVMARGYGANGKALGTVGCSAPLTVSPHLTEYRRVPEATKAGGGRLPRWDPPRFPFAQLDVIGRWAPLAMSILGFLAAILNPCLRGFVRKRWEWGFVIFLVLGVSALGLGALLLTLQLTGIALLPLVAALCLRASRTP